MWLRTRISDGRKVSARAARSAASIPARSLPSGTDTVCQP
jgi:hypothetical protein